MTQQIYRRDFLKTALGSSLLAVDRVSSASALAPERVDVLVIGAGVSGLAAAQELKRHKSVFVLEARNRLGGRVWTDRSLKRIPLELGAQWVHGIGSENALTKLVKDHKLQTKPTNYDAKNLYDEDGKALGETEMKRAREQYRKLMMAVREDRRGRLKQGGKDIALQAAIDRASAQQELTPRQRQLLGYSVNTEIEHEYGADASDLSLLHYDSDDDVPGKDVMFPGGYDQVVQLLAEGLTVKLEHVVQQIELEKDRVTVTTDRGVFQADRVLVTLPLGVLQANKVTFKPALPDRKLAAIRRMAMGVLNRVVLHFPKVFWPQEAQVLGYVGKRGEWAEWYDLARLIKEPVLEGFNAASFGRALETQNDETILRGALAVLRKLYGKDVPEPDGYLITRWSSDPFAGGSYSHLPPGSTPDDRKALTEPIADRLFFAGEATSLKSPATVHGAIQSGMREARRIAAIK